jgi:hypothetical protein
MIRLDGALTGLADTGRSAAAAAPPTPGAAGSSAEGVEVSARTLARADRADTRRALGREAALRVADDATRTLDRQRSVLSEMKDAASKASSDALVDVWRAGPSLVTRFASLARTLDEGAGPGGNELEAALDATRSASVPMLATSAKALGLDAPHADAKTALARVNDAIARVDDASRGLASFRQEVAKAASAAPAPERPASTEAALSLAEQIRDRLAEESGIGVPVGAKIASDADLGPRALALLA